MAAQGELDSVWSDEVKLGSGNYVINRRDNKLLRANKNRTWIQVWKQYEDTRYYEKYVRQGSKWKLKRKIPVKRATPWIDAKGVISDQQVESSSFDLLQEYLTQAPKKLKPDAFKTSVGYKKENHESRYVKPQTGKSNSTVAPFTMMNMLAIEVGESTAKSVMKDLSEQIANSEFAGFLGGGDVTQEQLEALRTRVEAEVRSNLGALGSAMEAVDEITPEFWLRLEGYLQDQMAGVIGDDAREFLSNYEVPEFLQESICEAYVE